MKLVSVVTPCYNEEDNVQELYRQVKEVMQGLPDLRYEHIFIDNASRDRTVPILKELARADKNVKIIVNTRNFGTVRSPYYGFLQAGGDAIVSIAADLQDPPGMIRDFIAKWREGYKVVVGIKKESGEARWKFVFRNLYYSVIGRLSSIEQIKGFMGFGLYDREVIDVCRRIDDPYPYFRGLIADLGYEIARFEYVQPARKRGLTKNNLYTLYDTAMLGITNHSKVPLRLAAMLGFVVALGSFLVAVAYLIYKLVFWETFSLGIAPLVIGLFFFSSVQLLFIGIIGEYIGAIHTQVLNRPLVIEKERVNF